MNDIKVEDLVNKITLCFKNKDGKIQVYGVNLSEYPDEKEFKNKTRDLQAAYFAFRDEK